MRAIGEKPKTLTNSLNKIKYNHFSDEFKYMRYTIGFPSFLLVENNESALIQPVKK